MEPPNSFSQNRNGKTEFMSAYAKYSIRDQATQDRIKDAMFSTYYADKSPTFLESEWGHRDVIANVYERDNHSLEHVVPWVLRNVDLTGKIVADIGCGTGSSTAAFSHFARHVHGYDIDSVCIDAARLRLEIMGRENTDCHLVGPGDLIQSLRSQSSSFDVCLLFAVLEHMTIEERHEAISGCWDLLSDDGLLVVVETPNFLQWFDSHTSQLPFFHLLDSEVCAKYSVKSPRAGFNDSFVAQGLSVEETHLRMTRWGRGVSYHDFELSLGEDYGEYLLSTGFEPEILSWFPVNLEEELLRYYVQEVGLDIPLAFTRCVLNLTLKKGRGTGEQQGFGPPPFSFLPRTDRPGWMRDWFERLRGQLGR